MAEDNIVAFGAYEKARKEASSSGGNGGDIDLRLSAVENKLENMASDVGILKADVRELRKDTAEIKGRLTAMPTTLQWLAIIAALIFTVMGCSFALVRFGLTH